jgi:VanZ family protein
MINKIVRLWLPALAWCSLIFYLSSVPNLKTEFGFGDLILRKMAHVIEYAVLFLLVRRAFCGSIAAGDSRRATAYAIIFSVLYAVSDEYHQSFVPTRGPAVSDVLIDTAGVLIACVAYRFRDCINLSTRFCRQGYGTGKKDVDITHEA